MGFAKKSCRNVFFQTAEWFSLPRLIRKARRVLSDVAWQSDFQRWIALYDLLTDSKRKRMRADIAGLSKRPVISLMMPISGSNARWLGTTIRSVQMQLYPGWELCFSGDADLLTLEQRRTLREIELQDRRVRGLVLENVATWCTKANCALSLASGEFIALIEPGDTLPEQALYVAAKESLAHSGTRLMFTDEDRIRDDGKRFGPWFKCDWNSSLMLSQNAFGRLGIYDRLLVKDLCGFRASFEGSEEYDLVLRCARAIGPECIRHIPKILYHRRDSKAASVEGDGSEAGRRAVEEHLVGLGISASVGRGHTMGYQVRYTVASPPPRVTIVMPTTARPSLLKPCMESLLRTKYQDFEVLLLINEVDGNLTERASLLSQFWETEEFESSPILIGRSIIRGYPIVEPGNHPARSCAS